MGSLWSGREEQKTAEGQAGAFLGEGPSWLCEVNPIPLVYVNILCLLVLLSSCLKFKEKFLLSSLICSFIQQVVIGFLPCDSHDAKHVDDKREQNR